MQETDSGDFGTTHPYLIFLREGPSFSPADAQPVCEILAQRFAGELWTYGTYELDTQIGRFRLRVTRTNLLSCGIGSLYSEYSDRRPE